ESTSGSQLIWMRALATTGVPVAPPILEVDSLSALKRAVAAGIGPGIVPRIAVEDDIAADRLREIPVEGLDLEVWVTVIWLPRTDLNPVARGFIDHVRATRTSPQPV